MMTRHYEEIINRIMAKTPDFDANKFHILIADENSLDGQPVESFTLSKDRKWVCIPLRYDGQFGDEYCPVCFEVDSELETWLGNGSLIHKTLFFILNKRL